MPRITGTLRLVAARRRPAQAVASARVRARTAVFATAVSALLIAAITVAVVERFRLDVIDAEYAQRRMLLAARTAEHPDRPLVLVAGSSRCVLGFAPEQLLPLPDAAGTPAIVFNASHYGAGPIMTRVTLGRLLADGVRPKGVVLELMPGFFARENARLVSSLCTATDMPGVGPCYPNGELWWEYVRGRATVAPTLFHKGVTAPAPALVLHPLGGFAALKDRANPDERRLMSAQQVPHFARLLKDWKPDPGADRAFRETVALCRRSGATVRLILTPEGPIHRTLYGPGSRDRVTAYAATLSRELDLPVTDARDWLDEDDFYDSHHPLRHGAAKFTARLGRDVIGPMLR